MIASSTTFYSQDLLRFQGPPSGVRPSTHRGYTVPHRMKELATTLSLLVFSAAGLCAQRSAAVTGVVRDAHGAPQMGALVEMAGAGTTATALTDLQGRYQIANLLPGVYQVRASASLLLPGPQRQVRLRAGVKPVINITLLSLFDDAAWLPVRQRGTGEAADDWKWTLRSPANRPMLRVLDENGTGAAIENGSRGESHARIALAAASGGYGQPAAAAQVSAAHRNAGGNRLLAMRSVAGGTLTGSTGPLLLEAMLDQSGQGSTALRIATRIENYPEIQDGFGHSLQQVSISSAQRLAVGELASIEVGSETRLLRLGRAAIVTHPFLRVSSRPLAQWSVSYALAESPLMAGYDDVGAPEGDAPALLTGEAGLLTESGLHQQLQVRRHLGRGSIAFSVHHDGQRRIAVSGMIPRGGAILGTQPQVLLDQNSETFRTLMTSAAGDGYSFLADVPVGNDFDLLAGYLNDAALALTGGSARPSGKRSQAVLFSVQGKIAKTGTHVTFSYRWQPAGTVSVVAPYEVTGTAPYLSVHLRQPLPHARLMPPRAQLTFDGNNMLAEGYRSAPSISQEAMLASALRELRAGIEFSF